MISDFGSLITSGIIGLLVFFLVFLLVRELLLWYWRVNEGIAYLKEIRGLLKEIRGLLATQQTPTIPASVRPTPQPHGGQVNWPGAAAVTTEPQKRAAVSDVTSQMHGAHTPSVSQTAHNVLNKSEISVFSCYPVFADPYTQKFNIRGFRTEHEVELIRRQFADQGYSARVEPREQWVLPQESPHAPVLHWFEVKVVIGNDSKAFEVFRLAEHIGACAE